jgi:outer membrane murein-binding lipoprotein Lpp
VRATNREINIFNMSLLDILTGMLGAFLFLMLGLLPFYSKAIKGTLISAEEKQKFDELKKLLDKGLKGPLSPEEAEQLRAEMERLRSDNEQLRTKNDQLDNDLRQAKQDLQTVTDEKNFWNSHNSSIAFTAVWDSPDADIDVMVLGPDGTIYGPKKGTVLGKTVFREGEDSHGAATDGTPYKTAFETGALELADGDYLVFYRVPQNAPATSYPSLYGFWIYQEIGYDPTQATKGLKWATGGGMGTANAAKAKPGGMYAWGIFNYDSAKKRIIWKPVSGKLPAGIQLPQ